MMKLYFMRHGQTNYNLQGLCNSDPSRDVHLTAVGEAQAHTAAESMKDIPLDLIIASPLPRTRHTAEIMNQYHHCPVEYEAAIADIRSGFEDRPVSEYHAAIAADPLHLSVNGGESLLEHKQRVEAFLQNLQRQTTSNILIVAHEESLRVVYSYFHGLTDDGMLDLHFKNCEILRFELT